MKVLFILYKDVYNIPAAKVAAEMIKRKYDVAFYGTYLEDIHIRMFHDFQMEIKPVSQLVLSEIERYDFIYTATTLISVPIPMDIEKYIFTFTTVVVDEPGGFADFTFTQRDLNIYFQNDVSMEKINAFKACPGKFVGNPKYDMRHVDNVSVKKQILFVDASHFPWGKKGKIIEAKMLLQIADHFPEYRLVIKPRFFPEDKNVTHRNQVHLYDCLEELTSGIMPSNIYCIKKHVDLEEVVRESEIIITPDITSSYLEIGAYNKKGIIAADIPSSLESMIHSKNRMERIRKVINRSELCVPYTKVLEYLPEGKKFSERHKKEMGLYKKDIARNIVNIIEQIYNDFIIHDIYPNRNSEIESNEKAITMTEVITYRYIKCLFSAFDDVKCRIEGLNFSEVENYIFALLENKTQINADNYSYYWETVKGMSRDIILNSKEILMEDALKQSYLLQSLYEAGKIQYEREEDYLAKEMFWCLMGKYEIIKGNNAELALSYFKKFFDGILRNEYEKTLADLSYYKESATYWSGVCHFQLGNWFEAKQLFESLEEMTNNNHRKAREYLNKIGDWE